MMLRVVVLHPQEITHHRTIFERLFTLPFSPTVKTTTKYIDLIGDDETVSDPKNKVIYMNPTTYQKWQKELEISGNEA